MNAIVELHGRVTVRHVQAYALDDREAYATGTTAAHFDGAHDNRLVAGGYPIRCVNDSSWHASEDGGKHDHAERYDEQTAYIRRGPR